MESQERQPYGSKIFILGCDVTESDPNTHKDKYVLEHFTRSSTTNQNRIHFLFVVVFLHLSSFTYQSVASKKG